MADFTVEGVDDDGQTEVLFECESSGEAINWLKNYTRFGDAGGWDLIEVYDMRSGDAERVKFWYKGAEA